MQQLPGWGRKASSAQADTFCMVAWLAFAINSCSCFCHPTMQIMQPLPESSSSESEAPAPPAAAALAGDTCLGTCLAGEPAAGAPGTAAGCAGAGAGDAGGASSGAVPVPATAGHACCHRQKGSPHDNRAVMMEQPLLYQWSPREALPQAIAQQNILSTG